jgi:activating signal cointegrator complex subunit 3
LQVVDSLKRGHQVMVFVHSRKDTGKTARWLADNAGKLGEGGLFSTEEHPLHGLMAKDVGK